jgi:YbbR domain-containing protein
VALRASPAASSVRLKDLVVDPPQVTVRGPASVIASMKEIQAEIPVDLGAEGKAVSEEVPLLAPPAVELNPQVVKVTWKIDVKRRTLSLQRDIIFEGENPNVSAQPSRANLMVSVPQAMVKMPGTSRNFRFPSRPIRRCLRKTGP